MARAIWSGSISFGLVNVPVRTLLGTDRPSVGPQLGILEVLS